MNSSTQIRQNNLNVPKPLKLDRLSLIRELYRSLINTGRTYAAFKENEVYPLVEKLADRNEILDPMSGYGLLTRYCSKIGITAYCIELNPPQYFWQILSLPSNASALITTIQMTKIEKIFGSSKSPIARVSGDWFTEESKQILRGIFGLIRSNLNKDCGIKSKVEELSLSLLIPFVGRLSCSVPGNNSTQIKQGGVCVYKDWENDYTDYLCALHAYLNDIWGGSKSNSHVVQLGDCRTIRLPEKRFSAMITSPPYPNHRDYFTMFAPENNFLDWMNSENVIGKYRLHDFVIGSNSVSGRPIPAVRSKAARRFLRALEEFRGSARAINDNRVYYVPYFTHYFHELEQSYYNIAISLRRDFEGYIIAVDNTARNMVIPVSESIIEIWENMGFKTEIIQEKEKFHLGTKNPRARGFKAKHREYTIRIWRR